VTGDAAGPDPDTFLSGESGAVTGRRLTASRLLQDRLIDLVEVARGTARRLDLLADAESRRRVLILSIYGPGSRLAEARAGSLASERHETSFAFGAQGDAEPALRDETVADHLSGGKFENLNRVLRETPPPGEFDWTLVVDDDVELPARFLDRFVGICGRYRLDLAQPAQTRASHAAWRVVRRHPLSALRETRFVEIGPVTAFRRPVAAELLPFPPLRMGWGLDVHWAALAEERGWRLGVVDALPVVHRGAPVAASYGREEATDEARRFLTGKQYLGGEAAQQTLATHRRVPAP
jgi:hypothetical protein